ncbi:MAG: dihydropteroate synthase [Bacteroides sp.]|nr:dihydropteroate synthase [Bacteroides sp.]
MSHKQPQYINLNGALMDLSTPRVMGILNLTPDSFFGGSRMQTAEQVVGRIEQMRNEGADMVDVGACSTRPGAQQPSLQEEMERLRKGLSLVREVWPEAVLSVDTYRSQVARMCVEEFGVAIVNDISAGQMDGEMFPTIAQLGVPYVMTHMQGTPETMQQQPHYQHILKEVCLFFAKQIDALRKLGAKDIILDPGFGFGKTLEHNYQLLANLHELNLFDLPLLVGVSRKSMVYKLLETTPDEALNGTTSLHTIALLKGANILRVHDVKEARQAVKIVGKLEENLHI